MVYSQSTVRGSRGAHTTKSPSPLRHTATISDSEDEDVPRRGVVSPSRASTYTTNTQYGTTQSRPGHRRGISDISPTKTFPAYEPTNTSPYTSPTRQSRAPTRQTLGDLSQATNVIVPVPSLTHGSVHSRAQSFDAAAQKAPVVSQRSPEREASGLGRAHSRRVVADDQNGRGGDYAHSAQPVHLDNGDLEKLGRSTTGHLKTLSKLAETGVEEDFTIRTKDQAVVGLQGRRRLQGNMSMKERTLHAPGYGGRIWMDQQRQYLQAYEYLCHIGEAKEWIQDVMGQEIPPIVQLEEHLRDGVTLAEIVQSLYPQKTLRIYRNPRLQYRHSDNIAIFFNFLAEVELPELFRFELVDLYEKKNIPKVIYCIHALSWLLFRKGIVDFKIGNLVGQLEFEQHELENMQKGLDQSGVSMPNFSGLRPEPVEPVETEEDRIDRELRQHDEATIEFQAQLRGALQRLQLGEIVQALGDHEDAIVDLQARLRGGWSRQIHDYQLSRRQFAVKLQSIARGYLVRTDQRERTQDWRDHEKDIVRIQAIVRARQSRKQTRQLKSQTSQHERGVIDIQAAIRGAMRRLQLGEHYNDVHDSHDSVTELQKHVRGMLTRRNHARRAGDLENLETAWTKLQSHARGFLVRKSRQASRAELVGHTAVITSLQTQIRAQQVRRAHLKQKEEIATLQAPMLKLQSAARTFLLQKVVKQDLEKVTKSSESIIAIQAQARGCIYRAKLFDQLEDFKENEEQIVELQASVRGTLARFRMTDDFQALVAAEDSIVEAQTLFRAKAILKAHKEKERFFKENMQKVVKIQSIFRGRQQGQAYKSLTSGKNPPVGTVKNFVHLLNDSDFDFEEEFETEKLQQNLVGQIQNIEKLEAWIAEMDAKIGLLAHNKIASDEAARLRHMPSSAHRGTPTKDSFNSRTLNKGSRAKLERYQELFFILQTQPQYLARLFRKNREQGTVDGDQKKLESLVMSTFAHAQKQREEYYFLKLLSRSIQEECNACGALQEFQRGSYFFDRLFRTYTRAPRDRKFLRQTFSPLIKNMILDDDQLDLESDPKQIYRFLLNDEELRTGTCSRDPNLPQEIAIKEPDVRAIFVKNLQDVKELADHFLETLQEAIPRLPFGVRYVTRQMFDSLAERYPQEDQRPLLRAVTLWTWKHYIKPIFTNPEDSGIIERSVDPAGKRNLNMMALVLNQLVLGREFDEEHFYLKPLNRYFTGTGFSKMDDIRAQLIDIPDAETKFDIGQFNDFYAKVKPTLYIKLTDVFTMHNMVANDVAILCTTQEDSVLRDVLRELGSARSNEAEMSAGQADVTLSLGGRMHAVEDPDAEVKAIFMETKRCVLYIIRIQTGSNLMEVMVKPVTEDDEMRWESLVNEELSSPDIRKRSAYTDGGANSLIDITSLSYPQLKQIALENIQELMARGRLDRHNMFQDILNEIAVDIRNKHRRRVQRQHELETVRSTISHLEEKQRYLQEKLDAYNNTYEQSLTTLQNKSAKRNGLKKFHNPFGKQAGHLRELARRGEEPRFGSYKYSAGALASKGILISWDGRNMKEDDITVSSDAINEFVIEGSRGQIVIPGACTRFTWDELLEAEYEGRDVIEFFGEEDENERAAAGNGRKSVDVRRGKSVDLGRERGRGVLRVDRRAFSELLSKKFWREAS